MIEIKTAANPIAARIKEVVPPLTHGASGPMPHVPIRAVNIIGIAAIQ
jgi:hypothetical protein